jgi:hypothetical protein
MLWMRYEWRLLARDPLAIAYRTIITGSSLGRPVDVIVFTQGHPGALGLTRSRLTELSQVAP